VLFLDAGDDVLVRRFESVRRPHPLQGEGTILDGILRERDRLRVIRESADVIIDTSEMNIHQLASRVVDLFSDAGEARHTLTVMSFGFKYGLPTDVDLVADMRFLPNPYWIPELKGHTGEEEPVRDFVLAQEGRASSSTRTPRLCTPCWRAISARTSGIPCSRSAAPGASTVRW
jgi:UPF0042 nucleotide-binding protein